MVNVLLEFSLQLAATICIAAEHIDSAPAEDCRQALPGPGTDWGLYLGYKKESTPKEEVRPTRVEKGATTEAGLPTKDPTPRQPFVFVGTMRISFRLWTRMSTAGC